MSRIGKSPITVPTGVTLEIKDALVTIKGAKGTLMLRLDKSISFAQKDNVVNLTITSKDKNVDMLYGTTRSLLNNAVVGVSTGWNKILELVGVGYRVSGGGNEITLMIGFSHPVKFKAPAGITFTIADNTKLTVSGVDKKQVGEIAAQLRSLKPPEPYKGKGIRYQGEHIRKKLGKAVKAAGAA